MKKRLASNEDALYIPGPEGQLESIVRKTLEPAQPIVAVLCHPHPLYQGTMQNKVITTLARTCDLLGIDSIRFNYRGVGESQGSYGNIEGEVADALAVIDYVKSRYPNHALWVMGFSFGAYIAARTAVERHAQQLVTVAPSIKNSPFDTLPRVECPWIMVQGDHDEVVSAQDVYDYVKTRPEAPRLIKMDASHFFHQRLTDLREALMAALQAQ